MNVYQENGYAGRNDYLKSLSEEYGVEFGLVQALSQLLGPDEDFDGLVCGLMDARETLEVWDE